MMADVWWGRSGTGIWYLKEFCLQSWVECSRGECEHRIGEIKRWIRRMSKLMEAIMPDLFLSAPWGHCTYLAMLNTYNYVVLGWNTTSTSIFTTLKTILLGFGPVDKCGRYCTEPCGRYCTEKGRVTISNIHGWNGRKYFSYTWNISRFFGQCNISKNTVRNEMFHLKYFSATSLEKMKPWYGASRSWMAEKIILWVEAELMDETILRSNWKLHQLKIIFWVTTGLMKYHSINRSCIDTNNAKYKLN